MQETKTVRRARAMRASELLGSSPRARVAAQARGRRARAAAGRQADEAVQPRRLAAATAQQRRLPGPACSLDSALHFRAVWRERQWSSDADADQAEKRFTVRLSDPHRSAPPEAWQRPGTCLAEALDAAAATGRIGGNRR
jgi:hypothetical protein